VNYSTRLFCSSNSDNNNFTFAKVIEACSLKNNSLKTKCRTIYATFRNVAQNLASLWQIFSLICAENFILNCYCVLKIVMLS